MSHAVEAGQLAGMPPEVQQMAMPFTQMVLGQLLRTAVELRLPTEIGHQPADPTELAGRVGADPDALRRLLDALSTFGFFRRTQDGRYTHTQHSSSLGSAAGQLFAEFMTADWMWQAWGGLTAAVRSGASPFSEIYGKGIFDYFAEDDPRGGEVFNRAMTVLIGSLNHIFVSALDLSTATTLVDVGGGQGTLLRDALRHNKNLRGVLFDLEPAIEQAAPELRQPPLSERGELVVGNVLESVPVRADAYLLRAVLHMWSDEDCVRVLRNIIGSAASGARVIVIEQLLPDQPDNPFPALMDLLMLLVAGGRERTEARFADLFRQAGLEPVGITTTPTMFQIIEARLP